VDDAPWLSGRIDYDKIDMCHDLLTSGSHMSSSVSLELVELLRFRRLSLVVKEQLPSRGFKPTIVDPIPSELLRFNHGLRSVAFRNGTRQVIRHEREVGLSSSSSSSPFAKSSSSRLSKHEQDGVSGELTSSELLKRLFLLESVTLVGCTNIQVSYFVDGLDVTLRNGQQNDITSDYLFVDDATSTSNSSTNSSGSRYLYIDTSKGNARLWVNCVVMAIKHVKEKANTPPSLL
jgi:hypothetical protein